jgi:hypothetical protein
MLTVAAGYEKMAERAEAMAGEKPEPEIRVPRSDGKRPTV